MEVIEDAVKITDQLDLHLLGDNLKSYFSSPKELAPYIDLESKGYVDIQKINYPNNDLNTPTVVFSFTKKASRFANSRLG